MRNLPTVQSSRTRYVVDTHALWWHINSSERLSRTASDIFQKATTGEVTIIIPAIIVAELYYLSVKLGMPILPSELMDAVDSMIGFELSDLRRAQLERLNLIDDITEMHDRLIAAEALTLDSPVITRDRVFSGTSQVETVW